jgi:hypothetical protein
MNCDAAQCDRGLGGTAQAPHRLKDPEQARGVEAIARNARVQTQLIADLLDISRITSGKLSLDVRWFDPRERSRPRERAGGVGDDPGRDHPDRRRVDRRDPLDQARFQQVIWNLLDNAVKFSRRAAPSRFASPPSLTASSCRCAMRGAASRPSSCRTSSSVFPSRRCRNDPLVRRPRPGSLHRQGLVEAHGSTVAATSDGPDRGATFARRIPGSAVRPSIGVATVESGQPTLVGVRVLIVEDDADARGLLNRVFTSADARVCEVEDVRGALDASIRFIRIWS